ncbi:MAG: hypothetical protein GX776_07750, partial [Oxalobacter sp.]|nr:hypothetical protein [Oxalobacter sp.]
MSKKKTKKIIPLTLHELFTKNEVNSDFLNSLNSHGTKKDHFLEIHGDIHAINMRFGDAIDVYSNLSNPTWKTKEKLAYCLYCNEDYHQALELYSSAPTKQSTISYCFNAFSLLEGRQWASDEIKSKIKPLLERIFASGVPPVIAYDILDIVYGYTIDDSENRIGWLTQGTKAYPNNQLVLSPYAKLALAHPFKNLEDVCELLNPAISIESTANFIWLGYTIAVRAKHKAAEQWFSFLNSKASYSNKLWLWLAAAEELLKSGDIEKADDFYKAVIDEKDKFEINNDEHVEINSDIFIYAIRGRLSVALLKNNSKSIQDHTKSLADSLENRPVEYYQCPDMIINDVFLPFVIDNEILNYESSFDLLSYKDVITNTELTEKNTAILNLHFALCERDD